MLCVKKKCVLLHPQSTEMGIASSLKAMSQ